MFPNFAFSAHAWVMALALGLAPAGPTWAQSGPELTTATALPAYQSTFDGYRSYSDTPVGGWKGANRDAADIGGWRAYAKAARAQSADVSTAPAATGGHGAHAGHGTQAQPAAGAQP